MAALIFAAPVRPTPAGLLADMLDTLETCVTEPQLRAWVSTTADFRAILPEMLLQRIERARSAREAEVEKQRRRARIADQMAQARVATRHRRADRLVDLLGDNLPAILPEIRRVQRVHGMTDTTFGRRQSDQRHPRWPSLGHRHRASASDVHRVPRSRGGLRWTDRRTTPPVAGCLALSPVCPLSPLSGR